MATVECGHCVRPIAGEPLSGDAVLVLNRDGLWIVVLVDALGHGPEAHEEACATLEAIRACQQRDPADILAHAHRARLGGRGAACAVACLDASTGLLQYAAVGNIAASAFEERWSGLSSSNGTVGHRMGEPSTQAVTFRERGSLFVHSDGVSRLGLSERPHELHQGDANEAAARYLRTYGRAHDDASCLLLRYRRGLSW